MHGYMGKLLRVDLTSRSLTDEPLNADYAAMYLGGSGLAARYLWDLLDSDTDPLGPENPLLFLTGPLVGTSAPACGRYEVCARSPLTGLLGESNSGGFWGPELRFAGYDGILLTGKSEQPVYVVIVEGKAQLRAADQLWGRDTYVTQDLIRQELGEPKARVACIGPGGEHLVKYAAVMNDHGRAAGRTGMGAVMGSKNLKAIAVRGSAEVPLFSQEAFDAARQEAWDIVRDDIQTQMLRLGGSSFWMDMAMMYGDVPHRYFTRAEWGFDEKLTASAMVDSIFVRPRACYRCPIGCGRETKLDRYDLPRVDGPEFETVVSFGSLLMCDDLEGIAYAGHLCNLHGLDTISAGSTIGFATYLFDEGIIGLPETGGLQLRWGDLETAVQLLEMIARREGFGALLAEGSRALGQHFGVEELAVQVNGLELPMHDPRAFSGQGLVYATSPRGACHMQGDVYMTQQGQWVPELGVVSNERFGETVAEVTAAVRSMDWRSVTNSLIMCHFQNPPLELVLGMLAGATGWSLTAEDLALAGERTSTLKRCLNR
ncbi:MAG TPA: aldehyde ferredoxin oxidoreductase family protein, partial [Anaerolineae bacterium]|nr:aldehyde ferredoxin oxidoreductase family protein [Anaerolineae bacterium]